MKIERLVLYVFLVSIILVLVMVGISIFKPVEQKPIQFEVLGVTGSVNASTLVGIHYECIKYCISHSQYQQSCWNECAKLGKEGCE